MHSSEDLDGQVSRRRRRVTFFKRAIVTLLFLGVSLPTLASVMLLGKIHTLYDEISVLEQNLQSVTVQLQEQKLRLEEYEALGEDEAEAVIDNESVQNAVDEEYDIPYFVVDPDPVVYDVYEPQEQICEVYLTFDDGPSIYTEQILDILAEYDVKATFFVVGKEGYEDTYRRILEEGHTLGMHSYSHVYRDIYDSVEAFSEDYYRLRDLIHEATGYYPKYYRFPGGSSNSITQVPITEFMDFLAQEEVVVFDWNISSQDAATREITTDEIVHNVVDYVGKYNTSVVLMHDAANKNTTIEALPRILEEILQMDNTQLKAINEQTKVVQHIHYE